MNANELADILEFKIPSIECLEEAATMLRQQQAEIEALKQSKFDGNNKVNFQLTDEEIAEIAMQCSDMDAYGHSQLKEYDFARAILRKAQEK